MLELFLTVMEKLFSTVMGAAFIGIVIVFSGLLFALPVYLLWNAVVPELFGLKAIGLFQAWGLLVLCGLLFKGSNSNS